jgi:hypothetical protein
MATNVWANWNPKNVKTGATRTRNQQAAAANRRPGYRKPGIPFVNSLWRSPTGAHDNAFTRAWGRQGNLAVDAQLPGAPAAPGSPGGGGYGGGGGGGGGGAPAITQAMIDAMAQALAVRGPQLQYQNLPAFQGQQLGAFNAAPYNTQRGLVDQAVTADQANFDTNQAATSQAVQGAYTNPYATAQVQAGPQQQTLGSGLMATAGGTASPDAANQVNQANAQNQGTFQDLLRVLAANSQAGQNSRMGQVAMDANYGRQNLNAQAFGLRGGIANNQAQAQNVWQQQAAERQYQNNLMAQQWARENAQGRQATTQANWQQGNTMLQARLQPILDLIAQTGGTSGLNLAPLMAALRGAGAAR